MLAQPAMQIVSEVKELDLGGGYFATELLGWVHVEQNINLGMWLEKMMPFQVLIIRYPAENGA